MTVVNAALNGEVLTVTLADEANRNALSRRLLAELTAVLDDADANDAVRVVVLTNSGRVFCSGADLREASAPRDPAQAGRASGTPTDSDPARGARAVDTPKARDLFGRFRRSPKPYVGRIGGHCVAGGMGLAAAMDISVARDDARFGFTEVRVGVAPAMISVLCLPKMRHAEASAAFLRGNRFSAAEAARMGLINAAVPAEQLDSEVDAVISDLLEGGPAALAASKQLLRRVPKLGFDEGLDWTEQLSASLFAGSEAAEGMSAFLQKRRPAWAQNEWNTRPEDHRLRPRPRSREGNHG